MSSIPTLPSSVAFTPLSPLPLAPRDEGRTRTETRPTVLPHDRVLQTPTEARPDHLRGSDDRSTDAPVSSAAASRAEAAAESDSKERAERSISEIDLERAGIQPRHHAVTYKVHPDLHRSLQSQRIDRDSSEVLRAIPSEERIQLARSFQDHVGRMLDTLV